jgi:hypothetical protein
MKFLYTTYCIGICYPYLTIDHVDTIKVLMEQMIPSAFGILFAASSREFH